MKLSAQRTLLYPPIHTNHLKAKNYDEIHLNPIINMYLTHPEMSSRMRKGLLGGTGPLKAT
jgi:hypothetical protein